jgi:hypothetical protein
LGVDFLVKRRLVMRRTLLRSVVVAGCLWCGVGFAAADDDGTRRAKRTYQTTNIFQFGNPSMKLAGGATLYRSRNGLEMRVATSGLNPNSAYTVWWVVFDNPAGCTPPGCGLDDVAPQPNPAAGVSVFYAAGFVTGIDGVGNVDAHVEAGALPDGIDIETGTGLDRGNGFRAEVHLVVRTHGTTTPGQVDQQIGSFNGGCAPACANQQAAVFMPVR